MKSELDRIKLSIDRKIMTRKRGEPPLQVFLGWKQYQAFHDWLAPLHVKQHGSILCDDKAIQDGYENILYKGIPVCLEPQRPRSITIDEKV